MHIINEQSPLSGADAATLTAWDAEITASVTGVDDVTMQQLHASHNYDIPDLQWNARFATMISRRDDGAMVVDLRNFHQVEPLRGDATD
jgi:inward rectifier potassium channel